MAILHLFIYLLNKLFLRCSNEGKWAWVIKVFKWIIQKVFIIFTFEYYIRSSLEINQYLLISSINEINIFNTSGTFKITSLIVACMMLMLCLVLFMVTVYLAFSSYHLNENEHNKLGEFYVGLKQQKKFTSYTPSVILRRTVFVIILITMASSSSVFVTGILSFLQLVYLIYVTCLRPFDKVKNNLIGIINEIYFLCLMSSLIYLDSKSKWTTVVTSIYVWIVASNNIWTFLIVLGNLFG